MKPRLPTEDAILKKISQCAKTPSGSPSARRSLALGIGDDAALFRPQMGHETILTCDWFLEGTHFLRGKHPPEAVGWKCLARAVSDIAAMGGRPRCFLLSLALPTALTGHWLDRFLAGLRRASAYLRCPLAGGDTTRRDEILINVTIVGEVRIGRVVCRSGARPGDLVYVSGRLGEADLGLRLLKRSKRAPNRKNPLLRKHLYPEPRLALGQWLASHGLASAMMDLSDGLSSDLPRLCAASGVGVRLEAAKIPITRTPNPALKNRAAALQFALHGGDDYELLFTVPRKRARSLPQSFRGLLLTPIGIVTSERNFVLVQENGREQHLDPRGWDPFRVTARAATIHSAARREDRHATRGAPGASTPATR